MKKIVSVIIVLLAAVSNMAAQDAIEVTDSKLDTIYSAVDTIAAADSTVLLTTDKTISHKKEKRDWDTWKPDVKKALWMAVVIPGGGQIYNRKFWKLPIVYGGFMGCIYAWSWNGMMYNDYSKFYKDLTDNDDSTHSYDQFLRGRTLDASNKSTYETLFKNRRDRFRRWRDLSIFCLIGVYAISIIDAYVDASLSQFDISDDLSLKVAPTYINSSGNQMAATRSMSLKNGGLGVRCQLNF